MTAADLTRRAGDGSEETAEADSSRESIILQLTVLEQQL
jgi:hypothetical protein